MAKPRDSVTRKVAQLPVEERVRRLTRSRPPMCPVRWNTLTGQNGQLLAAPPHAARVWLINRACVLLPPPISIATRAVSARALAQLLATYLHVLFDARFQIGVIFQLAASAVATVIRIKCVVFSWPQPSAKLALNFSESCHAHPHLVQSTVLLVLGQRSRVAQCRAVRGS